MSKNASTARETSFHPDNSNNIPWAEWSDVELKAEKWGEPKNGPDGLFLDTEVVPLPPSLTVREWIRVGDLKYLFGSPFIFTTTDEPVDLIANNKHLLHSEFMRLFISTLVYLLYHERYEPIISEEHADFAWYKENRRWEGWMHIYSLNKAGEAIQHRPIINPHGKYVVRMFFMGLWRRIVVDDTIPIDKSGRPLLPRTNKGLEIWPMLLAKATLKLASLTWTERREIVDFHPVLPLTGWIGLSFDVSHLSPDDKWDFLMDHVARSEWTTRQKTTTGSGKVDLSGSEEEILISEDDTKTTEVRSSRRMPYSVGACFFLEVAENGNFPTTSRFSVPYSTPIFVERVQDKPLDLNNTKVPLAKWESCRWLKYAHEKGIIDTTEHFLPFRYLKVVTSWKALDGSDTHSEIDDFGMVDQNYITKPNASIASGEVVEEEEEEEEVMDVGFWADFNGIASHVKTVQFFYEATSFRYSAIISDISSRTGFQNGRTMPLKARAPTTKNRRKTNAKVSLSAVKRPRSVTVHKWPHPLKRARNEPLYLRCDSVDDKLLLINFSSFQRSSVTGKLEGSNLIVERHSWFLGSGTNEPLASITTTADRSVLLELEPGRHLLRIFCASESRVFIGIFSQAIFHVGDRSAMYRVMCTESERNRLMAKDVADSINRAFQSFGTPSYRDSLKDFYRSYMPSEEVWRAERKALFKKVHWYFLEELAREVRNAFGAISENIVMSLRIFFLDPKIGRDTIYGEFYKAQMANDVDEESVYYHRAATHIQSFFRMVLLKSYMLQHEQTHLNHEEIRNRLLEVTKLFDHTKDDSLIYKILRRLKKRVEIVHELYPCMSDFQHVLWLQEYCGEELNVAPGQWLPLVRLRLNVPEGANLLAVFSLFTSLPSYGLRVFDSDTGREVFRVANNVAPFRYRHRFSETGYVIFGYGWSGNQRFSRVEWSLQIITMKDDAIFYSEKQEHSIAGSVPIRLSSLVSREVSNVYTPNKKNLISRCIVRARANSSAWLRLKVSCERTIVRLVVTDEDDHPLSQIDGTHVLMLPCVRLRSRQSAHGRSRASSCDVFRVEARVLHDSWPSTVRHTDTTRVGSRSPSGMASDPGSEVGTAYWHLQVIAEAGNFLELLEDHARREEIAKTKMTWFAGDGTRLKRGETLRRFFREASPCPSRRPLSTSSNAGGDSHCPRVKTVDDDAMAKMHRIAERIDDEQRHAAFRDGLSDFTSRSEDVYDRLRRDCGEGFLKRRAAVDDSYQSRMIYIAQSKSRRTKIGDKKNKTKDEQTGTSEKNSAV